MPPRLLILLPARVEDYAGFRVSADRIFPVPLPEQTPDGRLMIFDSEWRTTVLPKRNTITGSLGPFFEQNGIRLDETALGSLEEANGL